MEASGTVSKNTQNSFEVKKVLHFKDLNCHLDCTDVYKKNDTQSDRHTDRQVTTIALVRMHAEG